MFNINYYVMKNSVMLLLLVTSSLLATGKRTHGIPPPDLTAGADLVSRYVWRGINLGGSSPHIQPWIEYNPGNSGFVLGFWGSYGIGPGYAGTEADIFISYSPLDEFTFTLTDYFFPSDQPFSRDNYFNYKKRETNHTIEAMASFNGTGNFPFSLLFAINIYGDDGLDENGERYYAKYIEAGYSTSVFNYDLTTFIGIAPDNPKTEMGAQGWYGDSRGVINLGINLSREISISESFIMPVNSSLIFNPEAGNFYIVLGIGF